MPRLILPLCLWALTGLVLQATAQTDTEGLDPYYQQSEQVRGLDFRWRTPIQLKSREALTEELMADLDDQLPEELAQRYQDTYQALGLWRADQDLRDLMVEMLSSSVAGFYDPVKKELFLITDQEAAGPATQEQAATTVHELCHALQDQHYDLLAMQWATSGNDDATSAVAALIEGDASVSEQPELQGPMLDVMWTLNRAAYELMEGGTVPEILLEPLLFRYSQGSVFVQALRQAGGRERVDQAFADPPTTTEQILHPERYLSEPRDEPVAILMPHLHQLDGWEVLHENTLGELGIRIQMKQALVNDRLERTLGRNYDRVKDNGLLRLGAKWVAGRLAQHDPAQVAAGWDGDRYVVYRHQDGQLGLHWETVWDEPGEAEQFREALCTVLEARYGERPVRESAPGRGTAWRVGSHAVVFRLKEQVSLFEGFTPETLQLVEDAAKPERYQEVDPDFRTLFPVAQAVAGLEQALAGVPSVSSPGVGGTWAAARALVYYGQLQRYGKGAIPLLAYALEGQDARLSHLARQLMVEAVGQDLGDRPEAWVHWHKRQRP